MSAVLNILNVGNFSRIELFRKHSFRGLPRLIISTTIRWARSIIAMLLIYCMAQLGVVEVFAQEPASSRPEYHQLNYDQLDQLVAPIALYPDSLVAQILSASTCAPQVVEAHRFVEQNAGLSPAELARLADKQDWDPSVKALTAFPSVLANLDRNLKWTTNLGNTYYNQPEDVMAAVQRMRKRAYEAGELKSTPQENVYYRPGDIGIQPVSPAVVYVPVYNPWVVYGAPVAVYPAYYVAPPPAGAVVAAAAIGFAAGVFVGAFASYGWGCAHWAPNWYAHTVVFNHTTYISHSVTVYNHGYYGGYDHTITRQSYGPHGGSYTDQRTFSNGQYTNNRTVTGPHGATYTDQRTAGDGAYSNTRTATGPNGASYTDQRSVTNGQSTNSRTATGPNGNTYSSTTSRYAGGSSTTVTGPNGNTATRTVTDHATGEDTVTRTGPNGSKIKTRHGLFHRQG
jgi:hypothetical protein